MTVAASESVTRSRVAVPFPGLRPFDVADADVFFGREAETRELLSRLRRGRFLAILGDSGCGKSSLGRAGLVAALRAGYLVDLDRRWRIAVFRPGNNPVAELATALAGEGALSPGAAPEERALLRATLREGPAGLVRAVEAARTQGPLLIFVDQVEELFRFARDGASKGEDEARAFVKLLLEAASQRALPIYVVLTMRTEYLGKCSAFPGLPTAINQGLFLVPQMTRLQLRDAVERPVEAAGARISERLVNRLLNDLGDEADQLPVLQHALLRMWAAFGNPARDQAIDLPEYERIGSLSTALSNHLNEVYAGLADEGERRVAERVFRAITCTVDDGNTVRRPRRVKQLEESTGVPADVLRRVIDAFRGEGRSFLMPPPGVALEPETDVDISHESLIRQWKRLRDWAADEARREFMARDVQRAAARWLEAGRDASYLFRGDQLEQAEKWSASRTTLSQEQQDFLDSSRALREQLRHQAEGRETQALVGAVESRARAVEKHKPVVYLSYSREDEVLARRVKEVLAGAEYEVLSDVDSRTGTEWGRALEAGIDRADAVVAVVGPSAIASKWMTLEISYALRQRKRLVPVVVAGARPESVHSALRELQCLSFDEPDLAERLLAAVGTDLDWAREHTRLILRATEWAARGRETSFLLRGRDLAAAEKWLSKDHPRRRPQVTELQREFVLASHISVWRSERRRRVVLAVVTLVLVALSVAAGAAVVYARTKAADGQAVYLYAEDRRADVERALASAQDRLGILEKAWGKLDTDAGQDDADMIGLRANAELQRLVDQRPALPSAAGRVTIRYSPANLQEAADPKSVVAALRGFGYDLEVDTEPDAGVAPTNELWVGRGVPLEDAKIVAYTLIRAGVDLKKIDERRRPGRERVIQVGGSAAAMTLAPITIEQIQSATKLPVVNAVILRLRGSADKTTDQQFGGTPYCQYAVQLTMIKLDVTLQDGAVTAGQVRFLSTEKAEPPCPHGVLAPNNHEYVLDRIQPGSPPPQADGAQEPLVIDFRYVRGYPHASVRFVGQLAGDDLTGMLKVQRDDLPDAPNLQWAVTVQIRAKSRTPPSRD